MKRSCLLAAPRRRTLLACLVLGSLGCGSARVVSWAPEGGVVAIAHNTDVWPTYERSEAQKLMAAKCPDGYEIVEEGEVVTGGKTTASDTVDRRPIGEGAAEVGGAKAPHQTEYRIRFRPVSVRPAAPAGAPGSDRGAGDLGGP